MPSVGQLILSNPGANFGGLVTDPIQGIGIPFMLVGPILCAMCISIYVGVSLSTPPPAPEKLENTCWDHPLQTIAQGRLTGLGDPRSISIIMLVTMCVLYFLLR